MYFWSPSFIASGCSVTLENAPRDLSSLKITHFSFFSSFEVSFSSRLIPGQKYNYANQDFYSSRSNLLKFCSGFYLVFFNHRRVWFFKGTVCFRFVSGWWMQMELFLAIVFFLNRNFLSSLHHLLNLSFRTINGLDYVRKLIEEYQIYHSINREDI